MNTEKLQKYIENQELLIEKVKEGLSIFLKKNELVTINNKKYSFRIEKNHYNSELINYIFYQDYHNRVTISAKNKLDLISQVENWIKDTNENLQKYKDLSNPKKIEFLKTKRKQLIKDAQLIFDELSNILHTFPNEDIYKELLEIEYLEKFWARNY